MKNAIYLFFAALVLHTQVAAGDDTRCKTVYGQAMRACTRSPDLLSVNGRAGAQKACVEGAVLTRSYCMSGINACWDSCRALYEKSVAACEATFAPAMCAGETTCESIILQQRENCIANVITGLDACSDACP